MKGNNKILIHKKDGTIVSVHYIRGLSIRFNGENSTVEIYEPYKFKRRFIFNRSKIKINGNNNHVVIKPTKSCIYSIKVMNMKDNNKLYIGENFYQTGLLKIDYTCLSNMSVIIGDNCMFGQNISFMLSDWHKIYDLESGKRLNIPRNGISIGDNVWIARNVEILKNVSIPNNTVIATGSIVTKSFDKEHTILGGVPAKIIKQNVFWKK